MTQRIYTRRELEGILYEHICGDWDAVDSWWNYKNKAFDMNTPNDVYWSGEEGRQAVADYILKHAFAEGS